MNKDQIEGVVKEAAGKLQQKGGELVGSVDQQAKGLIKEAEGMAQQSMGDLKEAVKEVLKDEPIQP
jgi:uncharacterized protein YjbJ (UPF0337 family)